MNLQESVDYVVKKIVEQGGQCREHEKCMYGNDRGQHCAVGWLLDSTNEELMDFDEDVESLVISHHEEIPEIICLNVDVFDYIQRFHDGCAKNERRFILDRMITKYSHLINFTGKHWEQWVDMGE